MSKTSAKTKTQKKIVGEYEVYLDKVLGVGGFGKVLEGFDTNKKEKVAVKMIKSNVLINIRGPFRRGKLSVKSIGERIHDSV